MATLTCTNRKCLKTTSDSLLDETTNEIICSECGQPISGISDFTKRSMKGMGHVKKTQAKTSFAVKCSHCQKQGQPILKSDVPYCAYCKKQLSLSAPFMSMLKDHLKNAKEDE